MRLRNKYSTTGCVVAIGRRGRHPGRLLISAAMLCVFGAQSRALAGGPPSLSAQAPGGASYQRASLTDLSPSLTPSTSVSELNRQGRHFDAVVKVYAAEQEMTLADSLAGARSAWALGLVDTARKLWDEAFANKEFIGVDRARARLSRAILELQEGQLEKARALAERGAEELERSELRVQFWLVIAEALKEQGAYSLAEDYYKRALQDAAGEKKNEAQYLLSVCQLTLGKVDKARRGFASIHTDSPYTSGALRKLIEIDLQQGNFKGIITWIEEGRTRYAEDFSDGWSSYAKVTALLELGRLREAQREVERHRVRYTERDAWFALAEAAVEASSVRSMYKELQ